MEICDLVVANFVGWNRASELCIRLCDGPNMSEHNIFFWRDFRIWWSDSFPKIEKISDMKMASATWRCFVGSKTFRHELRKSASHPHSHGWWLSESAPSVNNILDELFISVIQWFGLCQTHLDVRKFCKFRAFKLLHLLVAMCLRIMFSHILDVWRLQGCSEEFQVHQDKRSHCLSNSSEQCNAARQGRGSFSKRKCEVLNMLKLWSC